jgi:hypothetical protein
LSAYKLEMKNCIFRRLRFEDRYHWPMKNYDVGYRSRAIVEKYNESVQWNDAEFCTQSSLAVDTPMPIHYDKIILEPAPAYLYPNPSTGLIQVYLTDIPMTEITFIISDMLGNELYNVSKLMTDHTEQIDLSELTDGIYYLRIFEGDNQIYQSQIQLFK